MREICEMNLHTHTYYIVKSKDNKAEQSLTQSTFSYYLHTNGAFNVADLAN